jgi:hypothetical protein
MKSVIIYRPQSEHASAVERFTRDIARQENIEFELINVDTPRAMDMMALYGIMSHPAILVLRDDGQLVQHWAADKLPLIHEVAAFARG